MEEKMILDVALQVGLLVLMGIFFLFMHDIPKKALNHISKIRNRSKAEAKRHFVRGAQLYAKAKNASLTSSSSKSAVRSLAKQAEAEADKAAALDPTDAAAHILKALALDLQGFTTSALDSLGVALSPLAAASLAPPERGDAYFKRAELLVSGKSRGGVGMDAAIADLEKAVELSPGNAAAFCLLGECYEGKGRKEEARAVYEKAVEVQPDFAKPKDALLRLQ